MNVTCLKCGHIHFALERAAAIKSRDEYRAYYDRMSLKQREQSAPVPPIESYEKCWKCGAKDFRETTEEEMHKIRGCTIQGVIIDWFREDMCHKST